MNVRPAEARHFDIPRDALADIESFLREQGRKGLEGAVLLCGAGKSDEVALLDTIVFPRQLARRSLYGVSVEVTADSVAEFTSKISAKGRILYAKIHSHPGEAYHSEADDENMMMHFDGAVSLVVPDFCQATLRDFRGCAGYRYTSPDWTWKELMQYQIGKMFTFVPGRVDIIDLRP